MTDNASRSTSPNKGLKRLVLVLTLVSLFLLGALLYVLRDDGQRDCTWSHSHYVDSGRYHHDLMHQLKKARAYLDFRLRQNARNKQAQRLAVVMAIDETALVDDPVGRRVFQSDLAMVPVRAFYDYAKARGVSVFFVSARFREYRAETISLLTRAGYRRWDGLLMAPRALEKVHVFKVNQRKQIEQQGYDIVINMGTNHLDLTGGHAEMILRLPAPYPLHNRS